MKYVDILIAIACFAIPFILAPIVKKSTGKLRINLLLAGVFFIGCGVEHLLEPSLAINDIPYWHFVTAISSWLSVGELILNRKKIIDLCDSLELLEVSWNASIAGKMLFSQKGNDLRLIRQNNKAKEANRGLLVPGDMLCEKMPSHREIAYPYSKTLIELYLGTSQSNTFEFRYTGQGVESWFLNMCVRFPETNYLYMTFIDISAIKEAALKDSLTELFNRRILDNENERWNCCIYLDLDKFKQINDARGHTIGDRVLVEVGKVLKQIASDYQGIAVREGGDEFLLLLNNADYMAIAIRCLKNIQEIKLDSEKPLISASLGLAWGDIECFANCDRQIDKLILAAETASRKAKVNKRSELPKDRIVIWSDQLGAEQQGNSSIDFYLRSSDIYNQLWLAYQPIVNMVTGEILGVEGLLRWQSPILGFVSPAKFIPVAENTGSIYNLSEWVVHNALAQLALWQEKREGFSLSINISPVELEDELFVKNISQLISRYNLSIGSLGIEVTERGICENLDKYLNNLRQLREANITLKMDDFGTGHSSLSQLLQFPFQEIKIDRCFVPIDSNDTARIAVCEAIAVLSESLQFSTIVEGVETKWQKDKLLSMGFRVAQGYYFYRPMTKDKLTELLDS